MSRPEKWTADDIPDLTGKVVVVTGGNSGIGFGAAKAVARKGAQTIIASRSQERGQRALDALKTEIPSARAELMALDLASLASVERFAEEFQERYRRLDVLANNAGIMVIPYGKTEDGFERQVGTNHLGHFALTGRLLDVFLATPGARVVNVSSLAHKRTDLDLDNLLYEKGGYGDWAAYARSKLLNMLFTFELQRRFERAGVDAHALAAHPGFSASNLTGHMAERLHMRFGLAIFNRLIQGPDMGALPTLRAATDPGARGGQYFGPARLNETTGHPVLVEASVEAHDEADGARLWEMSEELTGVRFRGLEAEGNEG
ncbi:MAG: oxidoreductase [Chloroflexi bacterium]|nr:oxidoreductase [Chloroflexota bacterium]